MLITPTPTDEEAVAIAAALQVVLNSGGGGSVDVPVVSTTWRFSGRSWSSPRYGARTTR